MSAYGITRTVLATGLLEAAQTDRNAVILLLEDGTVTGKLAEWLSDVAEAVSGDERPKSKPETNV